MNKKFPAGFSALFLIGILTFCFFSVASADENKPQVSLSSFITLPSIPEVPKLPSLLPYFSQVGDILKTPAANAGTVLFGVKDDFKRDVSRPILNTTKKLAISVSLPIRRTADFTAGTVAHTSEKLVIVNVAAISASDILVSFWDKIINFFGGSTSPAPISSTPSSPALSKPSSVTVLPVKTVPVISIAPTPVQQVFVAGTSNSILLKAIAALTLRIDQLENRPSSVVNNYVSQQTDSIGDSISRLITANNQNIINNITNISSGGGSSYDESSVAITGGSITGVSATTTDLNITGILSVDGNSGTSGQVLTSNGTNTSPTWQTISGGAGTTSIRSLFSATSPISYDDTNGIFGVASGYSIPLTASTTEWAGKISSQWLTSGSDISYTAGNVGIGTTPGFYKLDVTGGDINFNPTNEIVFNDKDLKNPGTIYTTNTDLLLDAAGANSIALLTTNTERMRITAAGNVGIGTTNPTTKLHVEGNGGGTYLDLMVKNTDTSADDANQSRIRLTTYGDSVDGVVFGKVVSTSPAFAGNAYFWNTENSAFMFATNNSERMRLSATGGLSLGDSTYLSTNPGAGNMIVKGNVGIGTTTPSNKLDVTGNGRFTGDVAAANLYSGYLINNIVRTGTIEKSDGTGMLTIGDQFNNLYLNNGRLIFGAYGTGNPMLKNNGAEMQVRLSDDSTFANLQAAGAVFNGNVGIGTTTPSEKLVVVGNLNISGSSFLSGGVNIPRGLSYRWGTVDDSPYITATHPGGMLLSGGFYNLPISTDHNVLDSGAGDATFYGNVGIGTTTPSNKLTVAGGNLEIDVTGSDTQNPRSVLMTNFDVGNAARYTFGSPLNSLQSSFGGKMQLQSYWGIEIAGSRQSGSTLDFTGGSASNASLNVIGTVDSSPVLTLTGSASQSGNLQEWRNNSGTPLSVVTSAGYLGVGTTTPGSKLTVAGDINLTGNIYQNGVMFSGGGGSSQWTSTSSDIYYNLGKVGIGNSNPISTLDINPANSSISPFSVGAFQADPNTNIIPEMSSYTSPSGVASASTEQYGAAYAWNAFNSHAQGDWNVSWAGNSLPLWLRYQFPSPHAVNKYAITAMGNNASQRSPSDWTFEGSNDGISWSVLDTRSSITSWTDGERKVYTFSNSNSYEYYRINISNNASGGSADMTGLGRLEMYESATIPTSALAINSSGLIGLNNSSASAQLHIKTNAATTKGLIIEGFSGQTADLQQWKSASGILGVINSAGNFGVGTSTPGSKLTVAGNIETTGDLMFAPRNGQSYRPWINNDFTNGNFDIEYNGQQSGSTLSSPGSLFRLSPGVFSFYTKPGDGSTSLRESFSVGDQSAAFKGFVAVYPSSTYGNLAFQAFDIGQTFQQMRLQNYSLSIGKVPSGIGQGPAHLTVYGDGSTDLFQGIDGDGSTVNARISASGVITASGLSFPAGSSNTVASGLVVNGQNYGPLISSGFGSILSYAVGGGTAASAYGGDTLLVSESYATRVSKLFFENPDTSLERSATSTVKVGNGVGGGLGDLVANNIFANNIGVGTSSPASKLDVWGDFRVGTSSIPALLVDASTGNTGLGTANPGALLDVGGYGSAVYSGTTLVLKASNNGYGGIELANAGSGFSSIMLGNAVGGGTSQLVLAQGTAFNAGTSYGLSNFNTGFLTAIGGIAITAGNASPLLLATDNIERLRITSDGNIGIGTTTPFARLTVVGDSWFSGTTTIAGGFDVGNGAINYNASSGITSIDNLSLGALSFEADSGIVSWIDMPVTSSAANGLVQSYTAALDGNPALTIYSTADGSGGVQDLAIGIGTTTPTLGPLVMASGAYVTTGGTWTNASDKNLKANFTELDSTDILNKIGMLPITRWNYKSEATSTMHVGPMAQDFYEIFGLGGSNTSISTIDPSGIALAGIQALNLEINGTSTASSSMATTTLFVGDSFMNRILNSFSNLGIKISQGVLRIGEIFASKIHTKEICVGDSENGGETCLTKTQIDTLLIRANQASYVGGGTPAAPDVNTGSSSDPIVSEPETQEPPTEEVQNDEPTVEVIVSPETPVMDSELSESGN